MVKVILGSLNEVFSQTRYLLTALSVASALLILAIWLPNLHLITNTLTAAQLSLGEKTNLLTGLLGGLQTNFTLFSRTTTIITVSLFGINVSLLIYYFKKRTAIQKSAGTSVIGMVSGILGVGCASCGSVILSSIFGLGATAGFIGILPFRGQEFAILAIAILTYSIHSLTQKIHNPLLCQINK